MSVKTILVAASGGGATNGAVDLGCRMALRFKAHLEGFHAILDTEAALAALGEACAVGLAGSLAETMMAEGATRAARTRTLFVQTVTRHQIPLRDDSHAVDAKASAFWREEFGYAPALVARRARFFDLVVLGRSERAVGQPYTDTIEETLAYSGRPILLAPVELPPTVGNRVALAWNGSPQAVRALAASLPFLAQAKAVSVITAADAARSGGADCVLDYLAWHGINAEHLKLTERAGRHVGKLLLDGAREHGADLLVMGGYGHAPWREAVFGGATHEALGATTMPLLLVY